VATSDPPSHRGSPPDGATPDRAASDRAASDRAAPGPADLHPRSEPHRPPPWRDVRVIRIALQVAFVVVVLGTVWWLLDNLVTNLSRLGIRRDFGFLDQPAGFTIIGSDFRATSTIREALLVGLRNTLRVALLGIVLATLIGVVVGVMRLSRNWLVRRTASIYVELLRNIPPLVLITFFYFGVLATLPGISDAATPGGVAVVSNRGLWVPWLDLGAGATGFYLAVLGALIGAAVVASWRRKVHDRTGEPHHRVLWGAGTLVTLVVLAYLVLRPPVAVTVPALEGRRVEGGALLYPEYFALLISLVLYTSSFIAEIVRGSIQAVPKGQVEAADALGLSWFARLRLVVLPQALRIATPATGNEFLNLSKNVSLGVVIAYPELLRIGRQAVANGQPAPQTLLIVLGGYLAISLVLSALVNLANRRLQLVER
jgi:general L-amino acid transport system permease protein